MRKLISIIVISCLLAGVGIYVYIDEKNTNTTLAVNTGVGGEFKPKVGELSPDNQLPDLNDQLLSFGSSQPKLQLINFWASWCGPCELEAPDLIKLSENYSDIMTIYGINSTKYDNERQAREFVEQYGFEFDILFDREGDITDLYRVNNYPTSFLVDQNGIIRERINGVIPYEEWERLIKKWS